jgi:hypothetical protein
MESFLQNRTVLTKANGSEMKPADSGFHTLLQPPAPGATLSQADPSGQDETEPQVELVNQDGRIERIVVTCTCCKRIELRCEY